MRNNDMYAVVKTGGKQYKVAEGDKIKVEKLVGEVGNKVSLDEVLAVGDVEFQKKCLGKMKDVNKNGRTIIFVSHNMNAIEALCNKAFLIKEGNLIHQSKNVRTIVQSYLSYTSETDLKSEWVNNNKYINTYFMPTIFSVKYKNYKAVSKAIKNNEDIIIIISGVTKELSSSLRVGYTLFDENNNLLYKSYFTDGTEKQWPKITKGKNTISSMIPKRLLNEGRYRLELAILLYRIKWIVEPQKNSPSIYFTIQGGLSDSPNWMYKRFGIMAPVIEWTKVD
jgi:lipopolysaccharide transport system ATP-binding protein